VGVRLKLLLVYKAVRRTSASVSDEALTMSAPQQGADNVSADNVGTTDMNLSDLAAARRARFDEARARRRQKPSFSVGSGLFMKKPAPDSSADAATSSCSTYCGSVDDGSGRTGLSETNGGSHIRDEVLRQMGVGQLQKEVCESSPRSHFCVCQNENTRSLAEAAYSGDGFDQRWLAETEGQERLASSLSGDGTIANVGRNVSGSHQCGECCQRFGCETGFKCHMKFMHDKTEEEGEWLPFPFA